MTVKRAGVTVTKCGMTAKRRRYAPETGVAPSPFPQAPNSPLPIRGEDAANAAGEGTADGGATRPVIPAPLPSFLRRQESIRAPQCPRRGATRHASPQPQAPRHSRESGNLPDLACKARPTTMTVIPAKAGIPPPSARQTFLPQRSNGAHLRSKSAHSALTECSFGAQKALKRRSFSAHCPRTAQAGPRTLRRPRPTPRKPPTDRLAANPPPRLPQAVHVIMTHGHCAPLRPLLP